MWGIAAPFAIFVLAQGKGPCSGKGSVAERIDDFLNPPLLYDEVRRFRSPARYFLERVLWPREWLLGHAPLNEEDSDFLP